MGFVRHISRWLAEHFGPLDDPPLDEEALEGSPLDLAHALELAVDHCSLMPRVTTQPPEDDPED